MNDEHARLNGVHRPAFLLLALLFLATRIALLVTRHPFFDEIFTVWMARQPLADVIPNLLHDSGPPLYYWIARVDSVTGLRWMSLGFGVLQVALIAWFARWHAPHPAFGHPLPVGEGMGRNDRGGDENPLPAGEGARSEGEGRAIHAKVAFLAATLLAVYPPAVLSAVDARAYALCALFVTAGVLALAAKRPFLAAAAFVVAAYGHYYGVLFFPVLLTGIGGREEAAIKARVAAFMGAGIAFVPGFIFALRQPSQALGWNREPLLAPLLNLSWTGNYPEALFAPGLPAAGIVGLLLLLTAVTRSWRFAPAVLVPLSLVLGFHLAGRPIYFPMRFESVVAGPLVLWAASSLRAQRNRRAAAVTSSILMLFGAISVCEAIWSHAHRPLDPYRNAALVLRDHSAARTPVVATGFCYLETVVALGRPVIAWPAEQAIHPGWRAQAAGETRDLPEHAFLWIGERQSPELARLREARRLQPLFVNERAVIARIDAVK